MIDPIISGEVSMSYDRIEDLQDALPPPMFSREPVPYEAAFLAGKCFMTYRKRGGTARFRMPDFLIGAHAAVAGHALMTRDAVRYRSYVPKLPLITPEP